MLNDLKPLETGGYVGRTRSEIIEHILGLDAAVTRRKLAWDLQLVRFVATRESEIGQGLLTLTRGFSKTGSRQPKNEAIHALCIDTGSLPSDSREALEVSHDEQLDWMRAAAERGCSLLVLCTPKSLEFYTTDQDRFVALRQAVTALAARVRAMPELGKTRTLQLNGNEAARHLFAHTAQLDAKSDGSSAPSFAIQRAAAQAAASTALGPTLASLFRAAANVGRRIRQETSLDDANASQALREFETPAAERIVEEELATWQAQEAEIQRATGSLPPVVAAGKVPFDSSEPVSEVRLRIGTTIRPSISYLLEPKFAAAP